MSNLWQTAFGETIEAGTSMFVPVQQRDAQDKKMTLQDLEPIAGAGDKYVKSTTARKISMQVIRLVMFFLTGQGTARISRVCKEVSKPVLCCDF